MTTLSESAFAKVNLTLDVLGIRDDGYHELESVMQTISLCDDIQINVGTKRPWIMHCSREDIPADERNLAWKAAKFFFENTKIDPDGLEINITKRIPSEAGLGGGSSDAGAVLRALNSYYGQPYSIAELAKLGALVGSDVPFCVVGGTAMVKGRGEHVRRLPNLPECTFVLCKPDFSSSTPVLYKKLDETVILKHPNNHAMEQALMKKDLQSIAKNIYNVFDPVVADEHDEINIIKSAFYHAGALGQQMSGSGTTVFGIFSDHDAAERIYNALKNQYPNTFIAKQV